MDLHEYLRVLRKHWLLITACTLLGVAGALAATLATTKEYVSSAQLFVSARSGEDGISGAYQGGLFTQQRVKSYADIVDSPAVTQAVVDSLQLDLTPAALADRIEAEAPLDTVLINVSVRDTAPERARDIAAAVAAQFSSVVTRVETPDGNVTPPVKVSVVRPADLPAGPASPRPKVNLALGLLAGLGLGVGAAVLREVLDTSVKGVDELGRLAQASTLGVVAYDPKSEQRPLVVQDDPRSPRAEAFRQLRTNLQFVDVDRPPRVVVVTSPLAGEGKSTTSANLAVTLAQAGTRVVLVEADLRRPRCAEYLGIEGAVGLTSVLAGHCSLDDALQPWGRDLMQVLPSGPLPPNPSEILGSQHMRQVLELLQERADVVVVDAPPLLPVTDGAVLARVSDGTILVVRHGRTRREQVTRAVESLRAVDARVLGTVLNAVPAKGPDAGGYGYSYDYYDSRADRPRLAHDEQAVPFIPGMYDPSDARRPVAMSERGRHLRVGTPEANPAEH